MRHIFTVFRLGLVGPFGEYKRAYYALAKQNEIAEILRATAMGKKFKATPFAKFHELFPEIDAAETLGVGPDIRKVKSQKTIALKAVMSLGSDGAPAWLKEAMKE